MKKFGGEHAVPGSIIVRQRGTQWHPGESVGMGRDRTLFALTEGRISYRTKSKNRVFVSVLPAQEAAAE